MNIVDLMGSSRYVNRQPPPQATMYQLADYPRFPPPPPRQQQLQQQPQQFNYHHQPQQQQQQQHHHHQQVVNVAGGHGGLMNRFFINPHYRDASGSLPPPPSLPPPIGRIPPPAIPASVRYPPLPNRSSPQNLMDMVLPPVPVLSSHFGNRRSFPNPPPMPLIPHDPPIRFFSPPHSQASGMKRPMDSTPPVTSKLKQMKFNHDRGGGGGATIAGIHPLPPRSTLSSAFRVGPPPQLPRQQRPNVPNVIPVVVQQQQQKPQQQEQQPQPIDPRPSEKVETEASGSDVSAEYLAKMEEQRKKRQEVLRMKEERRRQKMAATSDGQFCI